MKSTLHNFRSRNYELIGKRIFNTPNLLVLGIAVAAAGLLYLGIMWNCASECQVVQERAFSFPASNPVA